MVSEELLSQVDAYNTPPNNSQSPIAPVKMISYGFSYKKKNFPEFNHSFK